MRETMIHLNCFKETKKELPIVAGFTIDVYFICNHKIYKGEYHMNKKFYAYKSLGLIDCFASVNGIAKSWEGEIKNDICTHWCYIDELIINKTALMTSEELEKYNDETFNFNS